MDGEFEGGDGVVCEMGDQGDHYGSRGVLCGRKEGGELDLFACLRYR